ncbi:MAG: amidohydrolase family protein [Bacteroidia bacterium]|nr:amidohydrolase family protein [Bacteroidia bacterium]
MSLLLNNLEGQIIALVGGNILHPETQKITYESLILITGDRITHIGSKYTTKIPPQAKIIDISGKWVIPGLIDGHVHFFQSGGLYTRPDIIHLDSIKEKLVTFKTYEQDQQWIQQNIEDIFRRYLACGITTVVDMGGPFWNFALRRKALQTPAAPTIITTGPLIATYQPAVFKGEDSPIIKVNSENEARNWVLKQLPHKPDFIKIWYITSEESAESNYSIVKAAIEAAHQHKLRVAVHATELKTAQLAVRAGADILVHSIDDTLIPYDFLQTLQRKKIGYIPTLLVHKRYREILSRQYNFTPDEILWGHPEIVASLLEIKKLPKDSLPWKMRRMASTTRIGDNWNALVNLKNVIQQNVLVGLGTDAGNIGTLHGASYTNEALLFRKAGLTNWQILRAATYDAAKMFRKEHEIGSIQKGKRADIVVLNQNPLDSILHLGDIYMVIKYGIPFLRDSLITFSNVDIVNIQLNAYNARNIEAFMKTYSENIKLYNFPSEPRFSNYYAMKIHYEKFFENNPGLYCTIKNRIVQGNFIIDQEYVTGLSNGQTIKAVATYEVQKGKIQNVWFIR